MDASAHHFITVEDIAPEQTSVSTELALKFHSLKLNFEKL